MSGLSATWTRILSSSRLQRSSQALSVISSKVWIFSGELEPRLPVDNQLDVIDIESGSSEAELKTLPASEDAPSPRVGTASTTANGYIWLFSGRGGLAMDAIEEEGNLWRYAPAESKWEFIRTKSTEYPASRSYHAMTSDGSKTIYIHAGCPAKGRLTDLWAFDIESSTWTQLPPAPAPERGGTSIAFCGGKIYRMGGFDGQTEQGGKLDIYDTSSKTWETVAFAPDGAEGPAARSVATLLAIKSPAGRDTLITMFGERDPSSLGHAGAGKMLADVWAFDVETSKWSEVVFSGAEAPAPRGWFDADVVKKEGGDSIIVHGGLAEDNSRHGDVWKLSFQ